MKKIGLAIAAAAAALGLVTSASSAGPAATVTVDGSTLVQKTGGVYLEFGGPRYYGYDGYYDDDYPRYRYGYYAPRRYYYGYDYGYRPYKYSRRWTKERFEHPLGRR